MGSSALPAPMRARLAALNSESALVTVRKFLQADVAGSGSLEELHADLRLVAQSSTLSHQRELAAVEAVLADPPPAGQLVQMVVGDGNHPLDDLTDAAAATFLRQIADLLRSTIDEATPRRS